MAIFSKFRQGHTGARSVDKWMWKYEILRCGVEATPAIAQFNQGDVLLLKTYLSFYILLDICQVILGLTDGRFVFKRRFSEIFPFFCPPLLLSP